MKKSLVLVIALALVFLHGQAFSLSLGEPESLDDWTEIQVIGNPQSTANDATMDINTSGGFAVHMKYFSGAVGMLINVKASQVTGDAFCGISKAVGSNSSGNDIVANIQLMQNSGIKQISYTIYESDSSGNVIKFLGGGFLGDASAGWSEGQDVGC